MEFHAIINSDLFKVEIQYKRFGLGFISNNIFKCTLISFLHPRVKLGEYCPAICLGVDSPADYYSASYYSASLRSAYARLKP